MSTSFEDAVLTAIERVNFHLEQLDDRLESTNRRLTAVMDSLDAFDRRFQSIDRDINALTQAWWRSQGGPETV